LDEQRFIASNFSFIEGSEWNGILDHFTKECGGNVHEKGIVNMTSSSEEHNTCWEVANYGWNDFWHSYYEASF
jgi:hypothetical protein